MTLIKGNLNMKKIAISAILIGLMGFAQAQVTVYGKARVYEESTKVGAADAVVSLTNDSSRLGIKGGEDLGNGLRAGFVIETTVGVDAPTANGLGDRATVLSLSNKFGSIAGGRDKHSVARVLDNFDSMSNTFGASSSVIHSSQSTRLQNAVFLSATPVAGLTVNYQNANSEVAGSTNAQAGSVDYTVGPFAASLARYDNGTTSASNTLGAKFKMAKTTVFGMYSNDTVANVASTGKSVGATHAMGAVTALAFYGEKESTKAYNLGATYNLSKNTMLHARYAKESAAVDTTKMGVGMEMNF